MPGIGWGEFLMIIMVGIVVLRPEDLPALFRQAGKLYREILKHYVRFKELTQESFDEVGRNERDSWNRYPEGINKTVAVKAGSEEKNLEDKSGLD
jgi:Sec-independent protein translocase protein TatA